MASKPANTSTPASSPWKAYTLEATGKRYWYNKETKQKSWTDPTATASSAAEETTSKPAASTNPKATAPGKDPAAKEPPAAASQPWKEYEANGKKYWYNKETKAKSWTNPNAPVKPPTQDPPKLTAAASSATTIPSREIIAKPSAPAAKDIAPTTVAGGTKDVKAPKLQPVNAATALTAKKATSDNKSALTQAPTHLTHSETEAAVSGSPHASAAAPAASAQVSTTAPAVENNRNTSGNAPDHGSTPAEHVTVEVKSKKKDWRGALDVGLKVLDSAMDRAKISGNLRKPAGHDAPVVKGPVTGGAIHDAPTHPAKEIHKNAAKTAPAETHKVFPGDHPSAKAPDHAPTPAAGQNRPKAASKLSWQSPFKKHAASLPPQGNEGTSSSIDDHNEMRGAPSTATAAPATAQAISATESNPTAALEPTAPGKAESKGLRSSKYDRTDYRDGESGSANAVSSGTPAGGVTPSQKESQAGQGAAAAGVGAVGGTIVGAAGNIAYNDYEDGQSSPPPTPPPEEDDFAPPSPPPELDVDTGSGPPSPPEEQTVSEPSSPPPDFDLDHGSAPGSPPNDTPPPSPPANDGDNHAGYTTYAFEQPPSPPAGDSGPPSPTAQSDPDIDQGPPSPAQSASPPAPASPASAPQSDDGNDDQPPASPALSASPSPPPGHALAAASDTDDD